MGVGGRRAPPRARHAGSGRRSGPTLAPIGDLEQRRGGDCRRVGALGALLDEARGAGERHPQRRRRQRIAPRRCRERRQKGGTQQRDDPPGRRHHARKGGCSLAREWRGVATPCGRSRPPSLCFLCSGATEATRSRRRPLTPRAEGGEGRSESASSARITCFCHQVCGTKKTCREVTLYYTESTERRPRPCASSPAGSAAKCRAGGARCWKGGRTRAL